MDTPQELQSAADEQPDITISHQEYEDGEKVIAVDFGAGHHPSVDIVGDMAIVVVDDEQYEFELPEGADDVTVNDGIMTIRG